ncbi:hypothetical protein CFJ40_26150 [Salmonella enterica]|nr:hypothetical protein [Salmonella enterica]
MTTMSRTDYAKHAGVDRKTVTQRKERGWLVMNGREIDVDASDAMPEKYRKTVIREDVLPEEERPSPTDGDEYQDDGGSEDMSPDDGIPGLDDVYRRGRDRRDRPLQTAGPDKPLTAGSICSVQGFECGGSFLVI